jgi:hypothetical protein
MTPMRLEQVENRFKADVLAELEACQVTLKMVSGVRMVLKWCVRDSIAPWVIDVICSSYSHDSCVLP